MSMSEVGSSTDLEQRMFDVPSSLRQRPRPDRRGSSGKMTRHRPSVPPSTKRLTAISGN
jgi:hypothetical protein